MNLQFISDSSGKTTGVFIPINEWDELKSKFKGIEQADLNIPEIHKAIVRERIDQFEKQPDEVFDFDASMNEIEKGL